MVITIDTVIARARKRQSLSQPNEVLAGYILQQEARLYDTTVYAHEQRYVHDRDFYKFDLWEVECPPADPPEPPAHLGEVGRAEEYPRDDRVPLLMQGWYAEAYVDNLFAMNAYEEGDTDRYNLFSARSNDTEQAWRNMYFRKHRGNRYAGLEWVNE